MFKEMKTLIGVDVSATRITRPHDTTADHTPRVVTVHLELIERENGKLWVLVASGGVTGYESASLEALQQGQPRSWCACAGCSTWDSLKISAESMQWTLGMFADHLKAI